jgi:hypothetical protein
MTFIDQDVMRHLSPFFVWFFFIFGLAGLAVGVRLVIRGNRMAGLFGLMNRWIPTQAYFNRRWMGLFFIAGGAFPLFMLGRRLYENIFNRIFGVAVQSPFAAWSIDAVWWLLIVGNLLAVMVGAMLLFFPTVLASAVRPYGLFRDTGEKTYLALDRYAESSPRLLGIVIAAGALVVVSQFGIMLFGVH